jgi:enamine deaminase RidA (YjgF/YER057c/UK114 family)
MHYKYNLCGGNMSDEISKRLQALGVVLPAVSVPAANYVPYTCSGNLVVLSGQLPVVDGKMQYVGKLGAAISIEDGQKAARLCALNVLAQLQVACGGSLDKVVRCLRLGVFVNGLPDFIDHPKVANGASDLIVEVLQDKGKHARSAFGVGSLPFGVAVEVEAMFEVQD